MGWTLVWSRSIIDRVAAQRSGGMSSHHLSAVQDTSLRTQRVYRRFAPVYDTVTLLFSLWRWRRWQERVLPYARGRVLDVGCGLGGKELFYLLNGAKSVTGLDISQTNARIAQSCFVEREPDTSRRPGLVVADAAAMPFADNSFGLAICTYTFEHLADPARVLDEIQRVIKPGAEVFISFPPYFSPWGAHLTDWIHFPWCQVLFSEKALLNVARAIKRLSISMPAFQTLPELTWRARSSCPM